MRVVFQDPAAAATIISSTIDPRSETLIGFALWAETPAFGARERLSS
jgi:hypothetical protein